ncbi:pirin family protein [Photobacterium angustum]|uniref:Pirin family protein n=1 Tax=Photobacterium angustum TaxID=661 RepID=A0A855SDY3_PHOAN|nr:pirin family protein [Photobacterium angustum]KJF83087.1 pirin [Photobacterium damselae subsp. damselae]KJG29799.1 pirin [Photobacterium angustum]KJG43073.1 pirin [Photobacterium angustum]KJG47397.1 pirin [Photobacterium angustum]KJG49367.1 pirin [Photobacterium angustum]
MIIVRHSEQRGLANFGWLNSKHTFSFGHYYDPQHMGFSALRVINDDIVAVGGGFDTHGHKDMEIISYVLEGAIEHKDSEGNVHILSAGEFQLMSAGSGIYHSEYNASHTEPLKFLQIWIQPNSFGNKPSYEQKDFFKQQGLTTIATPTGEDGTLLIKQDAKLHQLVLKPNSKLSIDIATGRKIYLHQVNGILSVNDIELNAGDGAKIENLYTLNFANRGQEEVTALLFDLP